MARLLPAWGRSVVFAAAQITGERGGLASSKRTLGNRSSPGISSSTPSGTSGSSSGVTQLIVQGRGEAGRQPDVVRSDSTLSSTIVVAS